MVSTLSRIRTCCPNVGGSFGFNPEAFVATDSDGLNPSLPIGLSVWVGADPPGAGFLDHHGKRFPEEPPMFNERAGIPDGVHGCLDTAPGGVTRAAGSTTGFYPAVIPTGSGTSCSHICTIMLSHVFRKRYAATVEIAVGLGGALYSALLKSLPLGEMATL